MTRRETEETALRQSARDYGCAAGDFLQKSPKVVCAPVPEGARRYLEGTAFAMASYGHCVVARTEANVCGALAAFLQEREPRDCFVFPALGALTDLLSEHKIAVLESGMYFLPDPGKMKEIPCGFPLKVLYPRDFEDLYREEWRNALCAERRELDLLAVAAYDGSRLIGLAGASLDCAEMAQIGVDVLPACRGRGIAKALTSRLAREVMDMGKVPFYCAVWPNIPSVRNALACGFLPAWAEIRGKKKE